MEKYPCPCCENLSLEEEGEATYEICTICEWENEKVIDPDERGGANIVSLHEAKINYKKFGKILTVFLK